MTRDSDGKAAPMRWVATPDPHGLMHGDACIGTKGGDKIDDVAVCEGKYAHLIAAAPALVEALEQFPVIDFCDDPESSAHSCLDWWKKFGGPALAAACGKEVGL